MIAEKGAGGFSEEERDFRPEKPRKAATRIDETQIVVKR